MLSIAKLSLLINDIVDDIVYSVFSLYFIIGLDSLCGVTFLGLTSVVSTDTSYIVCVVDNDVSGLCGK